ncbi:MAG: S8 family serine peptidase [Candidatus Diapherotrites archaeon]|jgi:hypothetical protein|uniref:S8 family serine peptidase n=1 Tax=Candidatus Iainarchaeum sp. TaxID=3101447 RepID=A0A8T5GGS5_9ARCH|nr:S8 family serine peptidase [Candidatus Diapherotrites archaeon]
MKRIIICLFLLLFLGLVFSLPLEQMTEQEQKQFNYLYPENKNLISSVSTTSENEQMISLSIITNDKEQLLQKLNGQGELTNVLGGSFHNLIIEKSKAKNILIDDSIKSFSLGTAESFLEYSNPTTNSTTFYNNSLTGGNASICIVDSGIRTTHSAFSGKSFDNVTCSIYGYSDSYSHGTHVAGIAFSENITYKGIAYGTTNIVNSKVTDNFGNFLCEIPNLEYCFTSNRTYPADVSNNSWGARNYACSPSLGVVADGTHTYSRYADALTTLYSKVIVFAAGNSGPDGGDSCSTRDENSLGIPADTYNVITVASMDTLNSSDRNDDVVSDFSSRGPTFDNRKKPDITAPGSSNSLTNIGIDSTSYLSDVGYLTKQGTSMSAPHVTGAAGLIVGAFETNWLETKALLINSAKDINSTGWDRYTGWGYLDLNQAYYDGNNTLFDSLNKNNSKSYSVYLKNNEKVTLTWDRFCNTSIVCSTLTDMNLYLYNSNNTLVSSSTSTIDNVEQVVANADGNYHLKVTSQLEDYNNALTDENYALAFSGSPFYYNTKLANISISSTSFTTNDNFYADVNVINNTHESRDLNLLLIDSINGTLDTNSFTLAPFETAIKRVSYTFNTGGVKNLRLSVNTFENDYNTLDNNYAFTATVDGNNIALTNVSLSPNTLYTSQATQNLTIDFNLSNLIGPTKDVNVAFYFNGEISDSNVLTINNDENILMTFTQMISAGEYGDQNILITTPVFDEENSTSDNNYSTTYTIQKIDSNINTITPSIASGTATLHDTITFDVNALNNGTTTRDINVLFYTNGVLIDSNSQSILAGETKTYQFTKIFTEYNNDLNFIATYDSNEYNTNDNNYDLSFTVIDINSIKATAITLSNILPYIDANRNLINNNFTVDANVKNIGTGNATDLNILLYDNNTLVSSDSFSSTPGDNNNVSFTTSISNVGTHEMKISIVPLLDENVLIDNNVTQNIILDGNALRITSILYSSSVNQDTNQRVDVNIENFGGVVDANIVLKQGSTILDTNFDDIDADGNVTISLYTQALSTTGTNTFTAYILNVDNDHNNDNNLSFNITVNSTSSTTTPTTTVPGGGSGTGTTPETTTPTETTKTNTTEETNIIEVEHTDGGISEETNEVLTNEEKEQIITNVKSTTSTRTMSLVTSYDGDGVATAKTKVIVKIDTTIANAKTLSIIETIPKSIASDADQITSGLEFIVRKKDPILEFKINVGEDIVYYVDENIDTSKIAEFGAPAITKVELKEEILVVPDDNTTIIPFETNDSNNNSPQLVMFDAGLILLIGGIIGFIIIIVIAIVFIYIYTNNNKLTFHKNKKAESQLNIFQKTNQTTIDSLKTIYPEEMLKKVLASNTTFNRTFAYERIENSEKTRVEIEPINKNVNLELIEILPKDIFPIASQINSNNSCETTENFIKFSLKAGEKAIYYLNRKLTNDEMKKFVPPAIEPT